jgi:hypothetical protein
MGGGKGFVVCGHDEETCEIYSKLERGREILPIRDQADWYDFEILLEKGLTGPNGPRVEVGAVEEVVITADDTVVGRLVSSLV